MPDVVCQTELLINGVWTDYSSRVRAADGITITRGLVDQQSSLSPQTSDFRLDNRDGLFTNRNPSSALFGLIPRYTQVRQSLWLTGSSRLNHLQTFDPYDSGSSARMPDRAALDITTDLDVRIDVMPNSWNPVAVQVLCGKYLTTGNQRGWQVRLRPTGIVALSWTPDGLAASAVSINSTAAVPVSSGRLTLRVTLDLNNGLGGYTVSFYTGTTGTSGTFTLLGSTVVTTTTGVASIFPNSASLEVNGVNNGGASFAGDNAFSGKTYGFELRSGLGGSIVAKLDPAATTIGATSFTDGLGGTWTLFGNARITSDNIRFCGELPAVGNNEWDITGQENTTPVRAQGALGRIMRGGQPIFSPLRRHLFLYENVRGYWPMEAAGGSDVPDSATTGAKSRVIEDISFSGSTPDGLAGSAGAVTLNGAATFILLDAPLGATTTGEASFLVYFKLTSLPAADSALFVLTHTGAGFLSVVFKVGPSGFTTELQDTGGTPVSSMSSGFGTGASPLNQWVGVQIVLTQSGANLVWEQIWHAVGSEIFYTYAAGGTTLATATVGQFSRANLKTVHNTAFQGVQFAHVLMTQGNTYVNSLQFMAASKGFGGETAGRRLARLAKEETLAIDFYGALDDTEAMGPQTTDTVLNLMQECQSVDGGLLAEARDVGATLMYVTRRYLGDQYPVQFTYPSNQLSAPLRPTDDDRYVLNDVTATKPTGGSARYELTTGTNSVNAPPFGINRVAGQINKNVDSDDQLGDQAEWEVFWRCWDEARVPSLSVNLNRSQVRTVSSLLTALQRLNLGGALAVINPPIKFVAPDTLNLSAFGYTESVSAQTTGAYTWDMTSNTVPQGPYKSLRVTSSVGADIRIDSDNGESLLNAGITSSATSMVIKVVGGVASGHRWIDSTNYASEFPIDVRVAGEAIRITAITIGAASGADWLQTATITRGIVGSPGFSKAQSAGAEIRLYDPAYIGMGGVTP